MGDQKRYVLGPLAQRRKEKPDHIQPEKKVLPEFPGPAKLLQIPICRRDQANVQFDRF